MLQFSLLPDRTTSWVVFEAGLIIETLRLGSADPGFLRAPDARGNDGMDPPLAFLTGSHMVGRMMTAVIVNEELTRVQQWRLHELASTWQRAAFTWWQWIVAAK